MGLRLSKQIGQEPSRLPIEDDGKLVRGFYQLLKHPNQKRHVMPFTLRNHRYHRFFRSWLAMAWNRENKNQADKNSNEPLKALVAKPAFSQALAAC